MSFSNQILGTKMRRFDEILHDMSDNSYADNPQPIDDGAGWRPLTQSELADAGLNADLHNPVNGFDAVVYTNDQGDYVVAFRGTESYVDGQASFILKTFGLEGYAPLTDTQYEDAIQVANVAKNAFGDDLAFTGHSLGDGLAQVASLVTQLPAVTFNPAGLPDDALRTLGLDPSQTRVTAATDGLIRRYSIEGDFLTASQQNPSRRDQELSSYYGDLLPKKTFLPTSL
jgi:putative lipase involved disintegration of autophagic bodies